MLGDMVVKVISTPTAMVRRANGKAFGEGRTETLLATESQATMKSQGALWDTKLETCVCVCRHMRRRRWRREILARGRVWQWNTSGDDYGGNKVRGARDKK